MYIAFETGVNKLNTTIIFKINNIMFHYLFYRIYIHFLIKEPDEFPLLTSVMYIILMKIFLFVSISLTIKAIFKTNFNENLRNIGTFYVVIFFLLLVLVFWLYYKKRVATLVKKYENHNLNDKFKLWMIFPIYLFLIFFPFYLNSFLNH